MRNKILKNFLLSMLSLIFVAGTSFPSAAVTINCDRVTSMHASFKNSKGFDAWFQKVLRLDLSTLIEEKASLRQGVIYWKTVGTRVKITYITKSGLVRYWKILPNKLAFASIKPRGNKMVTSGIRYKCDLSSVEVISVLTGVSKTLPPRSAPSTNSKLNKAKSLCTELGFRSGTEKHGDCVMKLLNN
jgi:hypothetical protein